MWGPNGSFHLDVTRGIRERKYHRYHPLSVARKQGCFDVATDPGSFRRHNVAEASCPLRVMLRKHHAPSEDGAGSARNGVKEKGALGVVSRENEFIEAI